LSTNAVLKVSVNYPTDLPFCTIRSMYVADGNNDMDTLMWKDMTDTVDNAPVIPFTGAIGTKWFALRQHASMHNTTSPDIMVDTY